MARLGRFQEPSVSGLKLRLGISNEAAELFFASDVIDLHLESYSFYRSIGYHPHRRHSGTLTASHFCGHADLPRLLETGITGATWVITANPLRPESMRQNAFERQFGELVRLIEDADGRAQVVRTRAEYNLAVKQGKHACFIGVQGANALPAELDFLELYAPHLLRITLMHLSDSEFGATSTPSARKLWGGSEGLSHRGHSLVERMNALRIGVDLAHIHPRGFWDAVQRNDPSRPLLVTHTGVHGAHPHWRNLDDEQLKAIARNDGVVGIILNSAYLGDSMFAGRLQSFVKHIEHAVRVMGDDHVAIGSDWDGLISTPRDMPTCAELPLLVDALLGRGFSTESVQKILGQNVLRVVERLKGG